MTKTLGYLLTAAAAAAAATTQNSTTPKDPGKERDKDALDISEIAILTCGLIASIIIIAGAIYKHLQTLKARDQHDDTNYVAIQGTTH